MIGLAASPGTLVEPTCSIVEHPVAQRIPDALRHVVEHAGPRRVGVDDDDLGDARRRADPHGVVGLGVLVPGDVVDRGHRHHRVIRRRGRRRPE